MIKEYKKTLHVTLDRFTLSLIRDGYYSIEWACMDFFATNARLCDFDDVDDVIIINERFVITDENFDLLSQGKTLIVSECEDIEKYKDWYK